MKTRLGRRCAVAGTAVVVAVTGLVWGGGPVEAAFPGINGKIACSSNRAGNFEIFTFNPAGTELEATRLTNNSANDGRPRYSPDGRLIAFESNMDGPNEIYIMNADGSNIRRLTFTGMNTSPAWSPGGDQIAYQSTRTAGAFFDVWKINIDGTGDTRLTSNPAEESLPAWSPNGDKIAYSSRRIDSAANVHVMNPDGTGDVSLPGNVAGAEDSWPSWSPDASMIAFHSRRDDPSGEEIYRMNADGTNVVRLTFNTTTPTNFDIFPAWSPDGSRIVWNSGRNAANFGEIYTMRASDGGDIIRITNDPAVDQRCDWQPLCTIYGSGQILGTAGDDIICGSDGDDRIYGAGGNDRILGLGGNDWLDGGPGDDALFGGIGDDKLNGNTGIDRTDGGIFTADQCVGEILQNCP